MIRTERSAFEHAVVTGAGNGIGRQFALQLAATGCAVSLLDIDDEAARRVAAEVRVRGGQATPLCCDIRDAAAVGVARSLAETAHGEVDLLINNAGVLTAGATLDTPLSAMRNAFEVNLWGMVHGCATFVPPMVERGRGHIINVASLAGMMSLPHLGAYGATKAAAIAYSETLAAEVAAAGVGVTVVCPSLVDTGFVARAEASDALRGLGGRLLALAGQSPQSVAQLGLKAARHNRLVAIPSASGAVALRVKRLAPDTFASATKAVAKLMARWTQAQAA